MKRARNDDKIIPTMNHTNIGTHTLKKFTVGTIFFLIITKKEKLEAIRKKMVIGCVLGWKEKLVSNDTKHTKLDAFV